MNAIILQFCLATLSIVIAGWFLVSYADQIAEVTKLGRLFVGSIFLAGATSLPELSVDINAIRENMPDLAVGDLIGSSLFNLLILAIADLIHRSPSKIFSKVSSKHALAAAMSISVTGIAAIAIFLETKFFMPSVLEISAGTFSIAIAYFLGMRLIYFDQKNLDGLEKYHEIKPRKGVLIKALMGYLISALVILLAAPFLAEAGGQIADISGLGKTFIGTTLMAVSTSLPELVSTMFSVRRGTFDLAIGNIFGSNTFNMILLMPLDLIYHGSLLAAVSSVHVFTCLSTILITSVAVMGQLYQVERQKKFIEADAFTVILLVTFTLVILYKLTSP